MQFFILFFLGLGEVGDAGELTHFDKNLMNFDLHELHEDNFEAVQFDDKNFGREDQVHPHEEPHARRPTITIMTAFTAIQLGRKAAEREVGSSFTYAVKCRKVAKARVRHSRRSSLDRREVDYILCDSSKEEDEDEAVELREGLRIEQVISCIRSFTHSSSKLFRFCDTDVEVGCSLRQHVNSFSRYIFHSEPEVDASSLLQCFS